jgi:hypothetical protein
VRLVLENSFWLFSDFGFSLHFFLSLGHTTRAHVHSSVRPPFCLNHSSHREHTVHVSVPLQVLSVFAFPCDGVRSPPLRVGHRFIFFPYPGLRVRLGLAEPRPAKNVRRVQRHRVRRDPDVHGVDGNHGYVLFAVRRRGGAGRGYVLGLSQIPRLFSKQD